MSICAACGGVIGRDCFNPTECMAITRDMAMRSQQPDQRDEQIITLTRRNASLMADRAACLSALAGLISHMKATYHAPSIFSEYVRAHDLVVRLARADLDQPSAGGAQ